MAIQRNSVVIVKGSKFRVISVRRLGVNVSEYVLRDEDNVKWVTVGKNVTARSHLTRADW